ncbi:MAG: adenosylcobinamide-GDP ribazoletransferase [Proteobacteria bacterium]|nr:adenosylcobinamide-GDP ribazoletransferase [Pseudomonadota bacterium]MBU1611417.1 adenosylcobinamide-GDP ribazoletransferase [Pseudomonadota bacterium]
MRGLQASLAFLTRLAPGATVEKEDLAGAMPWLPVVGAFLGLLCIGPFWLTLLGGHPMVQAWLCVLLSIYLTRALHLDGLSDICDGLATHLEAKRFWEITKDSRVGAFGVVGLVMALLGQVVLFGELFTAGEYTPAIWVFMVGRLCAVLLGFAGKSLARPGLGKLFLAGATLPSALFALMVTLIAGFFLASLVQLLVGFVVAVSFQVPLYFLARKVNGLNGDFLGASITVGELGALLGLLMVS